MLLLNFGGKISAKKGDSFFIILRFSVEFSITQIIINISNVIQNSAFPIL